VKLLLDTNIVIDIISRREGYEESLNVLKCCEARKAEGFVSVTTVLDVMYILRKHIAPEQVKEAVRMFLAIVDVADVRKQDIIAAFDSDMTDYEDATQAACARRNRADYIVTRNKKDFARSPVPALLTGEILPLIVTPPSGR
jgi:predicted nucleic acid-binding protein